ncbi:MAG: PilZ domain-containing protein [bacterium]|nr:PilZ domain-containing protein [bacterium]
MQENIKYEKLSAEIKKEIEEFHTTALMERGDRSLEDSMKDWFNGEFDNWLNNRFLKKGDSSRRKHFRLDVELDIKIVETLIEPTEEGAAKEKSSGSVINISKGGLYFKSKAPIKISSMVQVVLDLSKSDKTMESLEALAMVVRADKLSGGDFGIGLVFSNIHDKNKNLELFFLKKLGEYMYSR